MKDPERIDESTLKDSDACENLQNAMEEIEFNYIWYHFKTVVYNILVEVLSLKDRKHWD